jgi:RHS repeat-associated protein
VYIFSGSKVIAECDNFAAPSSPSREYIYSGSSVLAKIEGGATQYYHQDELSVRMLTDSNGVKIGEQGHFPYGESWYAVNATTKWQYTTYERDAESGNDYAMARYYVNRLGRMSSPDRIAGSHTDPQSLNRYAYAYNDPINLVDPSGLFQQPARPRILYWDCDPGTLYEGYRWNGESWIDTGWGLQSWTCTASEFFALGRGDGGIPEIEKAKEAVNKILTDQNDCSKFLNNSPYLLFANMSGGNYTAAEVFASDEISTYNGDAYINQVGDKRKEPDIATTTQATGFDSEINVNLNGAFFRVSAFIRIDGRVTNRTGSLTVGGWGTYGGNSLHARVTAFLHELAHNLGAILPDAGNSQQSKDNTATILANCKKAIDAVKK